MARTKNNQPLFLRSMLKSKIHRATVTEANLNYMGSITIDRDLMEKADFWENETVSIYNVTNGARFRTYVIPGPRGKGDICLNGAAAHKAKKGDLIIIATYAMMEESLARVHRPKVVLVDRRNRAVTTKRRELPETHTPFLTQ